MALTSPRLHEGKKTLNKVHPRTVRTSYFNLSCLTELQPDHKRESSSSDDELGIKDLPVKPSSKKSRLLEVLSAQSGSNGMNSTVALNSRFG